MHAVYPKTSEAFVMADRRVLVEAAKLAARRYGLSYVSFSEDWVTILEKGGQRQVICGYAIGANNDAAVAVAKDKVATYDVLSAAGLSAVPHFLLSTVVAPQVDRGYVTKLLTQYEELVVKPLKGSRGTLVARFNSPDAILGYITAGPQEEWAASPYVDIRAELRMAVFRGEVSLAYEKITPAVAGNLKLFNLGRGTKARVLRVQDVAAELKALAVNAMDAVGLKLGAVDIAINTRGEAKVLEINGHFSLDHFAELSAANKQLALDFYELVIGGLFEPD